MSFPRYPHYKDSGVEWLGEVPGHWEVISIKWLSPVRRGASPRPIDDPKYFDIDGEYSWVRIADVSACDGILNETTQKLSALGSSLSVKIAPSELFISIAGTVGKPCISAIKACIHDGFVYFPALNIDPKFLYRIFEAGTCYGGLGKWGTQLNLNTDTIGSIRIALPPGGELTNVLTFLDRETAKIDALVQEQRRLMELLKEKRQAVISHAVTKGLNPQAPMKPSGIEWLGDVPAHWATPAMYMRYSSELGKMLDTSKITGDHLVPYMRNVDVQWGAINFDGLPEMDIDSSEYERYSVKTGDLLICEGGEVGRAAIVPPISTIFGYQKALHRLRAIDFSEDSGFMYFTLLWAANTGIFNQSGSSTIAHLTGEQLRKYRFPKPPLAEQRKITTFLTSESAKFDALTAEAQRAIDLLQERRTALISAAVTGQIDVRQTKEHA
jgi:type I restriction enzyme, S subunit